MIVLLLSSIVFSLALTYVLIQYHNRKGKTKSKLYYSGIFYLLLSIPFLFTLFGILFSALFITTGLLFLSLDRLRFAKSWQNFLIPLPIILFSFLMIQSSTSKNRFLIPQDYKGRILIVHDCEDGVSRKYEGFFWRVYPINQDGVLFSKFSFAGDSFDFLNSEFYYVDDDGNRTEIKYLDDEFLYSDKINPKANSIDMGKTAVYGLWSIPHPEDLEITTPFDFIVDDHYSRPYEYKKEEVGEWVKNLERCGRRKSSF